MMTLIEYNELIDMLNRGHEVEFEYKGRYYYLERGEFEQILYEKSVDGKIITQIETFEGETIEERIDNFVSKKMFDGNSFVHLYSEIEIIDVD